MLISDALRNLTLVTRDQSLPMQLTFLGTRGEIEVASTRHRRHSAVLVYETGTRLMIDCGADWLDRVPPIAPCAIVLTHAHPDHAWGLRKGAVCPVYATSETLQLLRGFPFNDRRRVPLERTVTIGSLKLKAVPVEHSIRAPAVGYRISAKAGSLFYLPDVANLPNASKALRGIDVYIGDGATITRSMVRKTNKALIGHAPIAVQLAWCAQADVRCAIFTHCGSPIVRGDAREVSADVRQLGCRYGIDAKLACDGDRLEFGNRLKWIPKRG